jgi:hypothetical protein
MLAVLVAILVAQSSPAHATEPPAERTAEVVLLLGQSNMSGINQTAPVRPITTRVWFWSGHLGGAWWWPAAEPLVSGYGPGTDFGVHLTTIRPEVSSVMLIPCAVGGSTADRWVPGGDLYERCRGYAAASGLRPTGALVYQGESDAGTLAWAEAWASRFNSLVDGLRAEYGEIPVVYAQITRAPSASWAGTFPYWDHVRGAQAGVHLPGVAMVRTDDLWTTDDGIHLTWFSEMTVGQRMARAYSGLMP